MNKEEKMVWGVLRPVINEFLAERGFVSAKTKMRFYRTNENGIVHVIDFAILRNKRLNVHLLVLLKELIDGNIQNIEGVLGIYVGELLGPEGLGDIFDGEKISDQMELSRLSGKVLEALKNHAIQFFNDVGTRERFWHRLPEPLQSKQIYELIKDNGA